MYSKEAGNPFAGELDNKHGDMDSEEVNDQTVNGIQIRFAEYSDGDGEYEVIVNGIVTPIRTTNREVARKVFDFAIKQAERGIDTEELNEQISRMTENPLRVVSGRFKEIDDEYEGSYKIGDQGAEEYKQTGELYLGWDDLKKCYIIDMPDLDRKQYPVLELFGDTDMIKTIYDLVLSQAEIGSSPDYIYKIAREKYEELSGRESTSSAI